MSGDKGRRSPPDAVAAKPAAPPPRASHAQPAPPSLQAWAGLAARVLVGALLLLSGAHKAAAPAEEFMVVLEGYALIPESHLSLFARLVPWTEVFAGLFLLAGAWTRPAAVVTAGLSSGFFLALLSTKLRGIELPNCGCFGQSVHLERWQAMLLDAVLISLSVAAWRWGSRRLSLDNWVDAAPQ